MSNNRNELNDQATDGDSYDPSAPPLDLRVIDAVERCPNRTIRPARLSADLGISVDDACSELCGLLSAVGGGEGGASFTFEEVGSSDNDDSTDKAAGAEKSSSTTMTMVFTFPPDFKRRALRKRRTEDVKSVLMSTLHISFKVLKVLVAFGLVVSLAILTIAALATMVAALIALSRGGVSREHSSGLSRRMRSMFYTLRQLLWCYAMYGGSIEGQDPFLAGVAADLWIAMSLFCGNPMNFGFWWRASMLNRRRERSRRGWGSSFGGRYGSSGSIGGVEGVALISRGEWGHENSSSTGVGGSEDGEGYRGLLSVVVEFLFGPTPFWPGPSESDKWKLRAAAIVSMSSSSSKGVSLAELLPYSDSPPATTKDSSEGLRTVLYFNGKPVSGDNNDEAGGNAEARFMFPELMAESDEGVAMMANAGSVNIQPMDDSWAALFYSTQFFAGTGQTLGGTGISAQTKMMEIPPYLQEKRHSLTKLDSDQFLRCVFLGILNYVGLVWLQQSIDKGGLLEISNTSLASFAFGVLSFLRFYAKLFFVLPAFRLLFIVVSNKFIDRRNQRRSDL